LRRYIMDKINSPKFVDADETNARQINMEE
jgi:hypothetical protein